MYNPLPIVVAYRVYLENITIHRIIKFIENLQYIRNNKSRLLSKIEMQLFLPLIKEKLFVGVRGCNP